MTKGRRPDPGPDRQDLARETGPVVAGVVIETRPGQGPFVACRLEAIDGLEIVGGDGDHKLANAEIIRAG